MLDNRPIGVFDSGIGGLTVLSKLIEKFPNEDFIYVADTLHCPYGIKTPEEIKKLVSNVASFLVSKDVKAIVIACNTATANSAHLHEAISVPIVGVIEPTAKYAYKQSKNKNIAVLATNATIDSNQYQNFLEKKNFFSKGKRYFVKCSEFVEAIEAGSIRTKASYQLVKEKLEFLKDKKIDTVVLGCTHFGLFSSEISACLEDAKLVDCGLATSIALEEVLKQNNLFRSNSNDGVTRLFTTGDPQSMKKQITWFDKEYSQIEKVNI